ncbi:alpha/beta hydrolase [Mucilaginibacter sp.]|uniref:alpha/beta hydrolase n=1 Tax=Mucilaginibacter sp. TaxID=1882438 RepID=UPI0035BBE884
MIKQVLFIEGGGNGGFEADEKLAASLQQSLGKAYSVIYPEFKTDEAAPDYGWLSQIGNKINEANEPLILAGHSFGASMILKYLSENNITKKLEGIFLISTPFWSGSEDWKQGFILKENFAEKLPANIPLFFYHSQDDEEVPIDQLSQYAHHLPRATIRTIPVGGHQFNNDLSMVATDIKALG